MVLIDMTYRQVIANNGIPFALNLTKTIETRDEISDAQFDSMWKRDFYRQKRMNQNLLKKYLQI